jgi:hypothetical protein
MHRSKLAGFIIDCRSDDLEAAASFWGAALGYPTAAATNGSKYRELQTSEDFYIEVQTVDHESRIHVDIQSDDVEAEVERLEALGAKRIEKIRTWWVMEAPTGQRFCVIRNGSPDFDNSANTWD